MHLLYIITYTQYTYYIYIHYLEIHTQYLCSLCIAYTLEIGVVLDFADLLKDNLLEAVALHDFKHIQPLDPMPCALCWLQITRMCFVVLGDDDRYASATWLNNVEILIEFVACN